MILRKPKTTKKISDGWRLKGKRGKIIRAALLIIVLLCLCL